MYKPLWCILLVAILSACTQNNLAKNSLANNSLLTNSLPSEPSDMITTTPIKTQSVNKPLTAKDIIQPKNEVATLDEVAKCQQQGGNISKQGLLGRDFCVVEFADKDKVCTDGSDCQAGRCISQNTPFDDEIGKAIKGTCPSDNIPFGCYGTVNQGKFGGFLCVD